MARILIVDDSMFQRKAMRNLVVEYGHDAILAENGAIGLRMLEEETPDAVILDLVMPVLDGIGFLESVREQDCATPILVVSADVQDCVREQCMDLGARGFLNKPMRGDELNEALSVLLTSES